MEHTKGKWEVSRHDDNNDIIVRGEKEQIVANCTVDFIGGHPQGEEIQANAKLIAAAPKLLAVLQQTHKDYKVFAETGEGDLFDERLGANMEDAEAVIQEATT